MAVQNASQMLLFWLMANADAIRTIGIAAIDDADAEPLNTTTKSSIFLTMFPLTI